MMNLLVLDGPSESVCMPLMWEQFDFIQIYTFLQVSSENYGSYANMVSVAYLSLRIS